MATATRAFVCRIRTDIPAGVLQWTDLKPNTSQHNLVYDRNPQTGYLGDRVENDTLGALVGDATVANKGLAAYLIDHVIDAISGETITVAVANATAVEIIRMLDDKDPIDIESALDTGGAGAGTALDDNGSNGSMAEIMQILAGVKYTLPAGSLVGGLAAGAELGSYDRSGYRELFVGESLYASCLQGSLDAFSSDSFSYGGVQGAALAVYNNLGERIP